MILIIFGTNPKFFHANVGGERACAKQCLFQPSQPSQIYDVKGLGRFHGPLGPLREQGNRRNSKTRLVKIGTVTALCPGVKIASTLLRTARRP
jgi:hypothetical protein